MPERAIVTNELARLLGVLSHRHRIQIVEELRQGEHDVNTLKGILGISASRVSQHLSLLRNHHIVQERREGRHHYYSLTQPAIASWVAQGLRFIEMDAQMAADLKDKVESVRHAWSQEEAAQ